MSPMHSMPYEILGVDQDASEIEIRITYLQYLKKFQYDRFEDPTIKSYWMEKIQRLHQAYESMMISRYCDLDAGDPIIDRKRQQRNVTNSAIENIKQGTLTSLISRLEDELRYIQVVEYIKEGNCREAVSGIKKLLLYRKSNWVLYMRLAEVYLVGNTLIPARDAAEKAYKLGAEKSWYSFIQGRIEEKAGNNRVARSHYVTAYRLDPNNPDVINAYQRGSLAAEVMNQKMKKLFRNFLPTADARSFRYYPGMLTIEHMKKFGTKFLPDSDARSFRYSGML